MAVEDHNTRPQGLEEELLLAEVAAVGSNLVSTVEEEQAQVDRIAELAAVLAADRHAAAAMPHVVETLVLRTAPVRATLPVAAHSTDRRQPVVAFAPRSSGGDNRDREQRASTCAPFQGEQREARWSVNVDAVAVVVRCHEQVVDLGMRRTRIRGKNKTKQKRGANKTQRRGEKKKVPS